MCGPLRGPFSLRLHSSLPILALSFAVSACGFHLRGESTLPFETLNIAIYEGSQLGADLRRGIAAGSRTRLVENAAEAQAILQVIGEQREKVILSLTSSGRVNQFLLRYRFVFKVHDGKGRDILPPNEILLTRELTFSDTQVLAKEVEEQLLYRDMQRDMVQQIIRRLAAATV